MFCPGPGHCRQRAATIWATAPWPVLVLPQATPLGPRGSIPPESILSWEWADPPEVSVGRTTGSTWLAGGTLSKSALAGTSMSQALIFLRQICTQEDPMCNSPCVTDSTMEVGNWGPHAGSASMWTHMQCPQATVLAWILMVPNGRMVIL